MRFTLEVKSRADFDTWVSEQKVTAPDTVKAAP
jgi:heme/copper-type cytochrome/quinol oxidase subunit 2